MSTDILKEAKRDSAELGVCVRQTRSRRGYLYDDPTMVNFRGREIVRCCTSNDRIKRRATWVLSEHHLWISTRILQFAIARRSKKGEGVYRVRAAQKRETL
ncbi:hypothetical protein TWF132_008608 [Orbilia oligospora]|nr:hypothetical protein TWF132_008608 [Orbilia oligospora]